jgi:deoxyribodipyrimidine photo-lyase
MQGIRVNKGIDTIFWFRRDLRLKDNTALTKALSNGKNVQPVFIFDSNILDSLPRNDARVSFIYRQLERVQKELTQYGASLLILHGKPHRVLAELCKQIPTLKTAYWNRDYSPYAIKRDAEVETLLAKAAITCHTFNDHVILEPKEVLKPDYTPYSVFTPYANRWRQTVSPSDLEPYSILGLEINFSKSDFEIPSLSSFGFETVNQECVLDYPSDRLLAEYDARRDYPADDATSKVSLALRFGAISIRELFRRSQRISNTYCTELIWREFYQMILWHFPKTVTEEFKPKYSKIPWQKNEAYFERWKNGNTGIALVDAGMRELNATGFMHNRVRMVAASFLCKNLMIDWRWGEAYFAEKLLDYEMASNVGGWQWAASCGCDAVPYFRVFNPEAQSKKFDPKSEYIRRWVPEFQNSDYTPMVDLKQTRKACIEIFKHALNQ